jgi:hypothetical protein
MRLHTARRSRPSPAPPALSSQASILRAVRLDEVKEALGAEVLFSRWGGGASGPGKLLPHSARRARTLAVE